VSRFPHWVGAGLVGLLALSAPRFAAAAQVSAQLDPERATVGQPVMLVVAVVGSGEVETPRFPLPDGVQLLGSQRAQSFSWVNGRSSSQLQFRFTLAADHPGTYPIGPITVKVDGQELRSGLVALIVSDVPPGGGGAGPAAESGQLLDGRPLATLSVTVEPADPYVGQPVMLRARLIQRAPFAEDPQYVPPTTTGFWTDQPSRPVSSYADEPAGRVLVTETRTRMFPLASGDATIGEATAHVVFAQSDPMDPLGLLRSGRREFTLRSEPLPVHVRPLPEGAPAGFGGAVGSFQVVWETDRAKSARDVPFTVRLSVRGRGDLPLIAVPAFAPAGLEVFAQTVDDSLGTAGEWGPGRKRFQWTVLARREGPLELVAPALGWFDPADGRYHEAQPPAVHVMIGPAAYPGGASSPGGYPAVLMERPVVPGSRPVQPWAWALGGGLAGAAIALRRRSSRTPPEAPERARALEWLRAVGTAEGPHFWSAAEDSVEWLAARGADVAGLAADVRRARYGGADSDPSAVRARVVERLSAALPAAGGGFGPRALAGVALALGIATVLLLGWGAPMPGSAGALRQAETAARRGDLGAAREGWDEAWRAGLHTPPLAARLAWADLQLGQVGQATAWALRGRRAEPRDPALEWMAARAREAGGLLGAPIERWPVRRIEWAIAAMALAIAAGLAWPRQGAVWTLAILALACGLVAELEALAMRTRPLAVVTRSCTLDPDGLELQPGQVVRLMGAHADVAEVRAGEEHGHVPSDALEALAAVTGRAR